MKDDDFDFTRSKGHTDSYGTGPGYDHSTLTSSGKYTKTFIVRDLSHIGFDELHALDERAKIDLIFCVMHNISRKII